MLKLPDYEKLSKFLVTSICLFCGWGRGYSVDEEMRDGAMGKFRNVRDLTRIVVSRTVFSTEIIFRHRGANICLINIYRNLYSFFMLTQPIRLAPISPKLLFKSINIFSSKYCNKIVLAPFIFLIA